MSEPEHNTHDAARPDLHVVHGTRRPSWKLLGWAFMILLSVTVYGLAIWKAADLLIGWMFP